MIEIIICKTHIHTHIVPLGPDQSNDFPPFSSLSSFSPIQSRLVSSITGMDKPTAAAVVWAAPELRSLIINEMEIDEVRKSLCLSKGTFTDMVRVLYRRFHYKNYAGLYRLSVPVSTHNCASFEELIVSISDVTCISNPYDRSKSMGR